MRDNEWVLSYGTTSVTFGPGDLPIFNRTTPDFGSVEVEVADQRRPRADGRNFGTDYRGGMTFAFDLGIRGVTSSDARTEAALLQRAWRADSVRGTPGAVASLAFRYDGRERVVYGRPRRFAPDYSDVSTNRLVTAQADFVTVDDRFYGPALTDPVYIPLVPKPVGGLLAPLQEPLTTTESSNRSIGIIVGGEDDAWPVVEVTGPITSPTIEVVGLWRMDFDLSLAYDETLTIDTRPWARTVTRNGASVAGKVTGTSPRLADASIPPGAYSVALRGTSATGTPTATVRLQESYPTP